MAEEYESALDKLDAMMEGSYEFDENAEPANENDDEEELTTDPEGEEEEILKDDEDTDQEEDSSEAEDDDEADTTDPIDGEGDEETDEDDSDDEEDETEANTPADDDDTSDGEPAADAEDDSDTKDEENVDSASEGDTVDYQSKYEELLKDSEEARTFRDIATSEFQANGKTVRGSSDPQKVIQGQQMLHGYEGKMQVFKKHKPFLRALQENGMVEDTAKFDMAINIMKGDTEALKQHMRNEGIDPFEFDMDTSAYDSKRQTSSPMELALDDVFESANRSGVQDKVERMLGREWDNEGVVKLLEHPQDSAIIVEHQASGIYDAVQERISEKLRTDVSGSFDSRDSYDQYMVASRELEGEYQDMVKRDQGVKAKEAKTAEAERIATEKTRIDQTRKDEEYKKNAAKREEEANEARAKATIASKPKKTTKKVKKKVDKMKLTGDSFQDYFNKEILGMN